LPRAPVAAPVQARVAPLAQLSNERVQARFDARGRVESLRIDGVAIALRAPLCELVIFTLNYLAAPWRACSSRGPVPGAT